ncbi:MAG: 2-C-methyl-D-erythritol 4-phosphate cytidylyltransferase [Pirellulaceae bacterium]
MMAEEIDQCVRAARDVGAAILATPVSSTVKQVNADRQVERTIDRRPLWLAQTPQVAHRLAGAGIGGEFRWIGLAAGSDRRSGGS